MKIDIVGAGALGLLFGAKLADSGEQVRFWTRTAEQAALLKMEGIELIEPEVGARIIDGARFDVMSLYGHHEALGLSSPDFLLITTKQRHIDEKLLNGIRSISGDNTVAVCFQNGIGHLENIQQALMSQPIYAAITTEGAKRLSGRSVSRSGQGETRIGISLRLGNRQTEPQILGAEKHDECGESFVKRLETAGFPAFLSKDIDREIFRKLLINAVINPLTALWRVPNGQLLATEERRALLRQLTEEGELIYRTNGISFDSNMLEQIIATCKSTATNTSSMLKDVLHGDPTEIDYINGRLVQMAKDSNVYVPGLEFIWKLVRNI
ncbi:ketopantoate reductase family protein [Paenibacillus puldeungensis]|uniref:2-dehydropantoate 2-reductase n=1 Tax=Paenibacillus puldeungensis TaxID=696536 RepID=A0ABW3RU82_9BACL